MKFRRDFRGRSLVLFLASVFCLARGTVLAQTCTPPPPGMVGWWPGDNSAIDIQGGNNGTPENGVTFVPGKVGQAFSLNGTDQDVLIGNPPSLQLQDFTIDAWVQRASASVVSLSESGGPGGLIFSYGTGGYGLGLLDDGSIFLSNIGFDGVQTSTLKVADTNFHHVAVTKSGTAVTFFLDGVAESFSYTTTFTFTTNAYIGQTGTNTFYGLLDEVEVFNRAITATEIANIYNAGSAGKCRSCTPPPANMVGWWPGDGNTNDIQNGNNGTLTGGVSFTSAEVNQGFTFDGTGQVAIPPNDNLNINPSGFTADFWFQGIQNQPSEDDLFAILDKSHGTCGGASCGWVFQGRNSDHSIAFVVGDGSGAFPAVSNLPSVNILDGSFHHLAGTWDGNANTISFYIDGMLQGTTPLSTPTNNTSELSIGSRAGGGRPIIGTVDEVEVFNRALADTEIQAIYAAGSAGKCKPVCTAPPADMVSWWPGDGNGRDIQSNNNLSFVNGKAFANGKVGQAFSFNGSGFATAGTPGSLAITGNQVTLDGWINPTATDEAIYFGKTANGNNDYLLLLDGGQLSSFTKTSGVETIIRGFSDFPTDAVPFVPPLGQWTHIALTYDGATIKVYANGALVGSGTPTTTGNIDGDPSPFNIGGRDDGLDFNGLIDEVEVFNRTLSQAEITAIYNAGSAGKCKPNLPPIITSSASATFSIGAPGSFTVTTDFGYPAGDTITQSGEPAWVTFTDNGDGTATITGTPPDGSAGPNSFTITASNGVSPDATQNFTLTVDEAPHISSSNTATFNVGQTGSFNVTTDHGIPTPALSEVGSLPTGVTFIDNSDGTATISGTPAAGTAGSYSLFLTASNGVPPDDTQNFTLTVTDGRPPTQTPPSTTLDFNNALDANHASGDNLVSASDDEADGGLDNTYGSFGAVTPDVSVDWGANDANPGNSLSNHWRLAQSAPFPTTSAIYQANDPVVGQGPGTQFRTTPITLTASGGRAAHFDSVTVGYITGVAGPDVEIDVEVIVDGTTYTTTAFLASGATTTIDLSGRPAGKVVQLQLFNPNGEVTEFPIDDLKFSQFECTPPPTGIVAWYPGDGNADDISGNGNNGTLQGGATFGLGKVGQAFSFNGTTAYVSVPGTFGGGPEMTVDAWVRTDGVGVTTEDIQAIVSSTNLEFIHFQLSNTSGIQTGFFTENGFVPFTVPGESPIGVWRHIAMTAKSGDSRLYVDGVLFSSNASTFNAITPTSDLRIGSGYQGARFFDGLIDEVEIFNRALSATEVQAIYDASSAGKCRSCTAPPANMVGWWPGDGNAVDIQSGNNGTLQNGATFAPGEVAQAFGFDGASAVVEVPNNAAYDFGSSDFTIDTWVNFNDLSGAPAFVAHDEGGGVTNKWIFWLNAPNLQFHINGPGGTAFIGVPWSPTTGQWYHVAVTRSGGDTYKFYVNGSQIGTDQVDPNATVVPVANAPLTIGKAEGIPSLNGLLDEVEIFNRALTDSEIAAIADAANAGKCKPIVQFSSANYSVSESGGNAIATVTRTGDSAGSSTVHYATSNGTATAGTDYTATSGTLTFGPGVISQDIQVPIFDDGLYENAETFTVTLDTPSTGTSLGTQDTATVTIIENDPPPTVQFSASNYNVNEDAGTVTLTVTKTGSTALSCTVDYATSDGTATAPADYTATSGTVTLAANETSKTFTVQINNDGIYDGDQTFNVTLSNPSSATLGSPSTATVTVIDNNALPLVQFSATNYNVNEGDGTVTVTVTKTGNTAVPAAVNYATSDGTATAPSDYTTTSGTLTFAPTETSKTFTVPIIQDTVYEGNETFTVTLSTPVGATLGAPNPATVTIIDDDPPPVVQFSSGTYSVSGSAGNVTVTVTKTGSTAVNAVVHYATSNGTATAPGDYTATSGDLTFAPSDTSKNITIPIVNDSVYDGSENFIVTLSAPASATLGTPITATVTITDPNSAPSFSIDNVSHNEGNSGTTAFVFTVTKTGTTAVNATVDYATVDGTATAPSDYTAIPTTTLTFLPGDTTKQITVLVNGDTTFEADETFTVHLSGATNATIGTADGTGTIVNDDAPPSFSIDNVTHNEGDVGTTNFVFTVTKTGSTGLSSSVNFTTLDGTATIADNDYQSNTGTLTFGPTDATMQITVLVNGDTQVEADETFTVHLSGATNATIGTADGTGTIVNDDTDVTVAVSPPSVLEDGGQNLVYTFTRTGITSGPITVNFSVGGTASFSSDYTQSGAASFSSSSGSVTFGDGITTATVTIQPTADTIYESDETVILTVGSGSGYSAGTPGTATGTITNDDPAPTLSIGDRIAAEGSNPGSTTPFVFTVTITGNTNVPVTVQFATADGTTNPATGGATCGGNVDYVTKTGSLTFLPNETTKTITIDVCQDTTPEPNETFFVELSSPTDATISRGEGRGTIQNDDAPPPLVPVNTTDDLDPTGTCTVTHCTLREAINTANLSTNAVSITFEIPAADPGLRHFYYADDHTAGQVTAANVTETSASDDTTIADIDPDWPHSWWSILPTSALPAITQTVTIDGYSQTGATANSTPAGDNAVLRVELDGASAGASVTGLTVSSTGSTVRGLVINRFTGDGMNVSGGNTTVTGNFLGSDVSGTLDLGNTGNGISCSGFSESIGGSTAADINLISGNDGDGISFTDSNSDLVLGNLIGTAAHGFGALGNSGNGITFSGGGSVFNTIGDTQAGDGNTIAFNGGDGVQVGPTAGFANTIRGNSIYSNGTTASNLGIDLGPDGVTPNDAKDADSGPNNLQNFPVITQALVTGSTKTIKGTLNSTPGTTFDIDFYANSTCSTSGNGEGKTYLGSLTTDQTDANGDVSFTFHPDVTHAPGMTVGAVVTATSTGAASTSEFSACFTVADGSSGAGEIQFTSPTYTVNENDGTASITVTRVGGSNGAITANFSTSDGTAQAPGDYTAVTNFPVTYTEGETGTKTVTVSIVNDAIYEGNETVNLSLSATQITSPDRINPIPNQAQANQSAVLTIVEDDPAPTFTIDDVSHNEGDSGTTSYVFTITKTGSTAQDAKVDYATVDGTATAPSDYTAITPTTLTFLPGDTTKQITVLVNGDTNVENNETFTVHLSNAVNATISDADGTGTILNDDVPTPTPTPTATPTPTVTPAPTPTPTPSPTVTPTTTPTPTPTPTVTPTTTPTPTPTPAVTPTTTPTPTPTPTPTATPAQALNISTRLRVEIGDKVMIGGFIITGSTSKAVVLRGIGPSLVGAGIPSATVLNDPVLELHAADGALITSNDNWKDSPQRSQIEGTVFQPTDDREAVIVATLQAGSNYTAILTGKDQTTGIGLVEVYDNNQAVDSQLANISTRGFVQGADNVMIGGFILGGNPANATIAVRGIGPSLAALGLNNVLADPTLELRNENGVILVSNDDWTDDPVAAGQLAANGLALSDPKESGIFTSLPPGQFTAILAGKDGGIGIGLVEIYNVK